MTFASDETSAALAAPIELYKFTGDANTYRMTSSSTNKTNTEGTYTATPGLKRNKLAVGNQEEANLSLELELPSTHAMVVEYAFSTSPPTLLLEFWRAHQADLDDKLLLWKGQVLSWTVEGRIAKLKVPNLFAYVLDQPCPPIRYQAPCNHVLYDEFCGVDDTSFSETTNVDTISGTTVVLDAVTFADGACNGGEMIIGAERRMIVSNTGTTFTIKSPFAFAAASDPVTIRQGCDHSFATCKSKFSNGDRYGGFPLVPSRNPFSGRL